MKEEILKNTVNRDLILREKLALERTKMANDRTLLSFIRTSLYFSIAGLTINSFVQLRYDLVIELIFWILAGAVLLIGIYKFRSSAKKISESSKHIGNYLLDESD